MDSSYCCHLYHSVCTQNNGLQLLVSSLPFSQLTEQWTTAIGVNSTIQSAHWALDSSWWCQLYHSVCTQNNGLQLLVSTPAIGVNSIIQSALRTMDFSYWCQLYHSVCTQNNGLQLLVSTLPFSQLTEQWTPAIGVNFTIQSDHRTMDSSLWCQLYHSVSTQNNGLQLLVSTQTASIFVKPILHGLFYFSCLKIFKIIINFLKETNLRFFIVDFMKWRSFVKFLKWCCWDKKQFATCKLKQFLHRFCQLFLTRVLAILFG